MSRAIEPRHDPAAIVSRDPEVHSGDLVFAGTRVPVDTLLDHLKDGATVDEFLEGYPSVARWQAEGLLELAVTGALHALGGATPPQRVSGTESGRA
jgi:uncharacterized protein (DUF433 family)